MRPLCGQLESQSWSAIVQRCAGEKCRQLALAHDSELAKILLVLEAFSLAVEGSRVDFENFCHFL